ncbi:hypothetical protein [Cellulomonas sp. PSBB021]|uniref:hypothetical protein n=1 Tax=Cellulomonas sp. PSBB021 TaxID=2003551 RepID=UPI000B8D2AFD|nr:hypothetical protein [Cellulomonas sp. PSBB021]ASR56041.1 hypothetical protein CBP52_14130 [Cellulomonas sp. PSBB021]
MTPALTAALILATPTMSPASELVDPVTTVWEGRYRVDEDPDHEWRTIDGTALTTTTLDPFEVTELRSHLVG